MWYRPPTPVSLAWWCRGGPVDRQGLLAGSRLAPDQIGGVEVGAPARAQVERPVPFSRCQAGDGLWGAARGSVLESPGPWQHQSGQRRRLLRDNACDRSKKKRASTFNETVSRQATVLKGTCLRFSAASVRLFSCS